LLTTVMQLSAQQAVAFRAMDIHLPMYNCIR
jgi:hypothetical protein